jgi:ATP-binding cassette subfamily B protein
MNHTKGFLLSWAEKILVTFNDSLLKAESKKFKRLFAVEMLYVIGFSWAAYIVLGDVVAGLLPIGTFIFSLRTINKVSDDFSTALVTIAEQNERYLVVKDMLTFFNTPPYLKYVKEPKPFALSEPPEIIFERVSFKYPGSDTFVLQNVSCMFKAGERIGLVGQNGAGKTTFVKLLCRMYDPTEGRILVNGIDLRLVDISLWWSYIGVLFQDYITYDFTIKEAIAIHRIDAKIQRNDVLEAAKVSGADSFIEKLAHTYDHQLGVEFGGVELSKGQRQKMAIARTIYKKPFFLILDEPTASVDALSEIEIFKGLQTLSFKTGALLISHDFGVIKNCDQIIVLENGSIQEMGSHEVLMKKPKGIYKKLFTVQADSFVS